MAREVFENVKVGDRVISTGGSGAGTVKSVFKTDRTFNIDYDKDGWDRVHFDGSFPSSKEQEVFWEKPEDYHEDFRFEKAKMFDKVWSSDYGWGFISSVNNAEEVQWPIEVKFKTFAGIYMYSFEGFHTQDDRRNGVITLFLEEPTTLDYEAKWERDFKKVKKG